VLIADTALVGDNALLVGAGVAAVVSVLLGILSFAAAYDKRSKPKAKPLELAAICFGAVATIGGVLSRAVETGSVFLYAALAITIIVAGLILWGGGIGRWAREFFSKRRK
jgi:predicted permease